MKQSNMKKFPYAAYINDEDESLLFIVFKQAFKKLTERRRVILGLRLLGYTQSSIAKILSISRTSVGSIEKKAIAEVKDIINEEV